MSKNHSEDKRKRSLTENDKIRHLFLNLKQLALAILALGLGLLVILHFAKLSKSLEMMIILFFSFTSMGFMIARTKSIKDQLNRADECVSKSDQFKPDSLSKDQKMDNQNDTK